MYQCNQGTRVTLYVRTDMTGNRETAFRYAREGNVGVFYWVDSKIGYALSSADISKEDLLNVANAAYQQLNPPKRQKIASVRKAACPPWSTFARCVERVGVVGLGLRGHAIARHGEMVVAHVGVVGGEEHAEITGHAGQDQRFGAEVGEQHLERRELKARVLGLQHEVIVLLGLQQLGDRLAAHAVAQAVGEGVRKSERQRPKLSFTYTTGTPALRARCVSAAVALAAASARGRSLSPPVEIEGVDHVDDQQGDGALVGRAAVQIVGLAPLNAGERHSVLRRERLRRSPGRPR